MGASATASCHGRRRRGPPAPVFVARAGTDPGAEASVAWPDLHGRLQQAGALAAELAAAAEARAGLARRLEAALEARRESLRQGAALDEMRRRLEQRRARADELLVARRRAAEGV